MSTPNAALLRTCLARWAAARTVDQQIAVSHDLSKYDSLWTKEELATIKKRTRNFKPASK